MNRMFGVLFAGVLLFAPVAFGQLGPLAEIDGGPIVGVEADGVLNFRAIPYAAPPVGDLRWAPPEPVKAWPRRRDCRSFSPMCPQEAYPAMSLFARASSPMSEDCLYLNVWTESLDESAGRPVMVWIHGGGFTRGTGATDAYDGASLAKKGVVLVTINYRLGVFGFLGHPELTAESEHASSGNYAILDMIAALEWVRDNIETFGGDPGNVTIFGESAGSWAVSCLIGTPLAEGLFHRAIGESGGSFAPMKELDSESKAGLSTEAMGLLFQEKVGAASLAEMRSYSAAKLLSVPQPRGGEISMRPTIDRWVYPVSVMEAYRAGTHNDVPVLIGFNRDEATAFMAPFMIPANMALYEAAGKKEYGEDWPEVSRLYPVLETPDIKDAVVHALTESSFGLAMYTWAEVAQGGKSSAYLYYFTREPNVPNTEFYRSHHAAEIMYAFDNLRVRPELYDEADQQLADTVSSYWVNFARSGDPNGGELPQWPAYDSTDQHYMELGDTTVAGRHLLKERLEFWARRAGW